MPKARIRAHLRVGHLSTSHPASHPKRQDGHGLNTLATSRRTTAMAWVCLCTRIIAHFTQAHVKLRASGFSWSFHPFLSNHVFPQARAKLTASETSSRAKEAECLRLHRQLETARVSEASLESRLATVQEAGLKGEAEIAALKLRSVQVRNSLAEYFPYACAGVLHFSLAW